MRSVTSASGARFDTGRAVALALSVAAALFLWDSVVVWPLKLLVVMMHESGHAIATWIVGGKVDAVTIRFDESGACLSRLPDSWLGKIAVYSAGYVGSAVAGSLLLLGTFRFRLRRAGARRRPRSGSR